MERMVTIYKLTAPNGKSYVGQSCNLQNRFSKYKGMKCKDQPMLYHSLKKYGWENFTKEVLEYIPEEFADEYEQHYISVLQCCETGLNFESGGCVNRTVSESTKSKISIANKGKKRSDDTKLKLSIANTGKKHGPMTEEGKNARSKALIERFKVIVHPRKGKAPWNKGKKLKLKNA